MITRADVADLQPGDVVELRDERWPDVVTRGPLEQDRGEWLSLGGVVVASRREGIAGLNRRNTLTVVSRAPRPLYANSDRTEPVDHDVVRDGHGVIRHCDASGWAGRPTWWGFNVISDCRWTHTDAPPQPLTLLVDGETGQVVQ